MPENIEWIQISTSINEEIENTVKESAADWLMQIMPGDTLKPHALLSFAEKINDNPEHHFIYSDEKLDEYNEGLLFKPDFNLELLRSYSYLGRSAIIRREVFESIGGFTRLAYVYVTDFAFKVYELFNDQAIGHIEDVLYFSSTLDMDNLLLAYNESAVRHGHFERMGIKAQLSSLSNNNTFHVNYEYDNAPLISIVIANRNNATAIAGCIEQLREHTDYDNYEVILVDQDSDVEDMTDLYQELKQDLDERLTLFSYPEPNYSAMINFGVTQAKGKYVVVLSSLAMPINDRWLTEMCSIAQREDVAVVGARIIDFDNQLVHAGGVVGIADDVKGMFEHVSIDEPGYMNRAQVSQEYNFVSSACFMLAMDDYKAVGGLDEAELANSRFCIVDFCLRMKEQGKRNIWTSHAVLRQNLDVASISNGVCKQYKEDMDLTLITRWPEICINDRSYNRNLSLRDTDFSVETDMLLGWNATYNDRPRIMAFPFNSSGVGEYRVRGPLRALAHAAVAEVTLLPNHDSIVEHFLPNHFELHRAEPDVLLLQNTFNDRHYEWLKKLKAETDIFVVLGLDDLVDKTDKKNTQRKVMFRDMKHRLRRTLALCDRLVVSTQPLAEAYADLCDDIVVAPNMIESARWNNLVSLRNQSDKPRVGWAGGQQHLGDLEIIIDVIKVTADEIDWVFMGMCPDEIKPYVKEYHDFVAYELYPEKLASLNLDLAVAPLELNAFNEAKSNLRLLEYGILGWPVICSDIYPYQLGDAPVIRVNNQASEWLSAIRAALAAPDKLPEMGDTLQQWVINNFILEQNLAPWLTAFSPAKKN